MISRTVTLVKDANPSKDESPYQDDKSGLLSLADFRKASAVVLLGEPGMGKTTEFEEEVEDTDGIFITARNFKTLGAENYQGEPLFIDGLDEARADGSGVVAPFDEIRRELKNMGKPFFRISCREADWLQTDKAALEKVSSDGKVTVLRLDPLTDANIEKFLGQQDGLSISPQEFMKKARTHGVDGLMQNPRLLKSLIKATGESWPQSKAEVMERSVVKMAEEHNPEHASIGATTSEPLSERVQAAGFLCSLMLLADNPIFSMIEGVRKNNSPSLSSLIYDNHDALQEVVRSNLFKPEEGEVTYIHRSIAEYLCAIYLNKCLNDDGGPSIRRILALLTGNDGVPVSPLRGVFAWLAALSGEHRDSLMAQDPLGMVRYGDVSHFTSSDIQVLLGKLKKSFADSDKEFIEMGYVGRTFSSLCVPDAKKHLLDVLRSSDRSKPHQMLAHCVLKAMQYADDIYNTKQLLEIFKDSTWYPIVREPALESLTRRESDDLLLGLLNEIKSGEIEDDQDDHAGFLLEELYPRSVTARMVFDYLHKPKDENLIGSYSTFWPYRLVERTDDKAVLVLLDEMVKRENKLFDQEQKHDSCSMLLDLIARALKFLGEDIDTHLLVSWLSLGSHPYGVLGIYGREKGAEQIQTWFSGHPEAQKKIYNYCIEQYLKGERPDEDLAFALFRAAYLVGNSTPPSDLQAWYLDDVLPDLEPPADKELFQYVYRSQNKDAWMKEKIQKLVEKKPIIKEWIVECDKEQQQHDERELKDRFEHDRKLQAIRERNDEPRQNLVARIREHPDAFEKGTAPLWIFYNMGATYFGMIPYTREGDTPRDRLHNLLKDAHLVEVALEGLKNCVKRTDLPAFSDVIKLAVNSKVHLLSFALVAGIDEFTKKDPAVIDELGTDVLMSAVAVHLCVLLSESSDWYEYLLINKPDLVAEVMVVCFHLYLASGEDAQSQAHLLARDDKYRQIAPLVAIPALECFPLKSKKDQLTALADLLQAAWKHVPDKLPSLVERKLKYKSLVVGQRVHWLAMGALIAPEQYLSQLESCISGKSEWAKHLVSALYQWSRKNNLLDALGEDTLHTLIRIIVQNDKRVKQPESLRVIYGRDSQDLVRALINSLAGRTTETAPGIFRKMLDDNSLQEWHHVLSRASHEQQTRRRESEFKFQSIECVTATLAGGKPHNAAGVAAVTYEAILELADEIQNGNTNDFRQYWMIEKGSKGQAAKPESEEKCRDAFLSDLKFRLEKYALSAEPEGRYAEEKRSDIKVCLGSDINIPIEIKCSYSRDIWSTIHRQLIAKYTRDPGTSGYGIYLVFWFGAESVKTIPASGVKPKTAEQLCWQLHDSLKDSRERRLIQIAVIDCTSSKLPTRETEQK